jgi:hypothetical protein
VTTDDFWALIDATRPPEPDPDLHAAALTRELAARGVDATVAFAHQFDAAMDALYRWDLWGGGYLLLGGLSDDGFEYLRAWVVGEGRATWERVLAGPEQYLMELAAEVTANGGELFEELADRCFAEAESLLYAAGTAHEQLTGSWTPPNPERLLGEPAGDEWDEDAVEQAFPGLATILGALTEIGAVAGDPPPFTTPFDATGPFGGTTPFEATTPFDAPGSFDATTAWPGTPVFDEPVEAVEVAARLQSMMHAVTDAEDRYARGDPAGGVAALEPVLDDPEIGPWLVAALPQEVAAELLYHGGISRLQCGDPDGAATWLGIGVATGADDARVRRALAQVELTRGELDRAEVLLATEPDAEPMDLAIATAVAGYRQDRTAVLARGRATFEAVARVQGDLHPWDVAGMHVLVGLALVEVGEAEQALAAADRVATLVAGAPPELPLVAQGLIVAAGAHRLAGRIDPALDVLRAAWPMLQPDTCDRGMAEREVARGHRAADRPTEAADFYARAAATFTAAGERFLAAETGREAG